MHNNLLFDFSVDKENKTIHVKREFDAGLSLVWAAWTQAELLEQWWAPKPYQAKTRSMNFSEGGSWLYAMVGPDDIQWNKFSYAKIVSGKGFSALGAFCDENGTTVHELPTSHWKNEFSEKEGTTHVNVTLTFKELTDLEKIIEMGFKEGFAMGLENLDEVLRTLK